MFAYMRAQLRICAQAWDETQARARRRVGETWGLAGSALLTRVLPGGCALGSALWCAFGVVDCAARCHSTLFSGTMWVCLRKVLDERGQSIMDGMGEALGGMWPFAAAVLVVLGIVAIVALIVVLVRVSTAVKNANETVEKVNVLVDEVNEQIAPALKRVDPLVEQAALTVDTVNLELLRLDGILEDVESITGVAGKAADTVDTVTSAPAKAVAGVVERVRGAFGDAQRKKQVKRFVYPSGAAPTEEGGAEAATESAAKDAVSHEPTAADPAEAAAAAAADTPQTAQDAVFAAQAQASAQVDDPSVADVAAAIAAAAGKQTADAGEDAAAK